MGNFPTETSPAGMILAVTAVVVPLISILLSSMVRKPSQGFYSAWLFIVVAMTLSGYFSLHLEPGDGTLLALAIIGGVTVVLCLAITFGTLMFRRATEKSAQ